MIPQLSAADFVSLPKAELHVHTEGSMLPGTVAEFADRYGQPMPPLAERYPDWPRFERAYEGCRALIRSLDDLRRVVAEVFGSSVGKGVVWTELHLVPHLYRGRLGPVGGVVEAALDGLAGARADGGQGALILAVGRDLDPDAAAEIARLAIRHRDDGVAAMGLTGDEAGRPADQFAPAFKLAREAGLGVVPHAGESGSALSVANTLRALRPDRICHGVRAVEDPALLAALADRRVCLDVAVSGNVALDVFPSVASHPLPKLLDAGIPVSLNSDVSYLYGIDILHEYALAHREFGLDPHALAQVARDSLCFARANPALAERHGSAIEAWLRRTTAER